MNKKISQFEVATSFEEQDILTIVQDGENKQIHIDDFQSSLSDTFATNERVDAVEGSVQNLDDKVDADYADLSNQITAGDSTTYSNVMGTVNEYYDVLNNSIITLEDKHDADMSEVNETVQEWIDDIDERSTLDQLNETINRLTVAENTITALADIIANGGGSGNEVGFHTQPSSTITSLSGYYKGTSADPLVTTDSLNQALSKLENQIEAASDNSGSLPIIRSNESTTPTDGNIYTALKVKRDYLGKHGDTADGYTRFTAGIQGGNTFRSGWDGVGASLYPVNSKWNLEVDNLFVRGNMTVNELTVNEIKAVGGDILVTMADMKCVEVEETTTGYKCYFDDEEGTKYNEFVVNDQAICQQFDGQNVKRYWRAVTEVGSNYIVLSKEICEPGSGIPQADDSIILLGHRREGNAELDEQMEDRRNAIFISAKGENAPRIAFYSGIDDFSLEGKDKTVIGKNSKFTGAIAVTSQDGTEARIPIYRGQWESDKRYYYYDCVTYNGSTWIANIENEGQEPTSDSIYWSIYIAKGEDGRNGDDVAKWVEITGQRMFLYETPDFTGTPTPTNLGLIANIYGIPNNEIVWTGANDEIVGRSNFLIVTPEMFDSRTAIYRCTVTDVDTGLSYYDEIQIAKLSNGAEGADAYYIDLTNYAASVPFSAGGTILIDPTTISTNVYAYKGTTPMVINSISAYFAEGTGEVSIVDNKVTLQSLLTSSAKIVLHIVLDDGFEIDKNWYINQSRNGEDGFDGQDAIRTYLTGETVFHYKEYATVPIPSTITLRMDTSLNNTSLEWYWAPAGTADWVLLEGEIQNTLEVSPDGVYFTSTGLDEIAFKCVVGGEYEDVTVINKVRDGQGAFHGVLDNMVMNVTANHLGVVTDWSDSSTYAELWKGTKLNNSDYVLSVVNDTNSNYRVNIDTNTQRITVDQDSIPNSVTTVQWQVNFIYNGNDPALTQLVGQIVDTVPLKLIKNKLGAPGLSAVQIYYTSNSQPSTPTVTKMSQITASTSYYGWSRVPYSGTSIRTWVSTGYYDTSVEEFVVPEGGSLWTTPTVHSGKDGSDGSDGAQGPQGPQGPAGAPGRDGVDGNTGPGLSFCGAWNSTTTYFWSGGIRNIVKHGDYYYAVKNEGAKVTGQTPSSNSSYWTQFTSFDSIATGLLFADTATIAGWNFSNKEITSLGNTMRFDGNDPPKGNLHISVGPDVATSPSSGLFRVANNGSIYAANAEIHGKLYAKEGEFTGKLTADSMTITSGKLNGWKAPGVIGIAHLYAAKGSSGISYNMRYSTNGFKVTGITNISHANGTFVVSHNANTTNYIAFAIGSPHNDSISAFLGSSAVTSRSSGDCTIWMKDTDNQNHIPGKNNNDSIDLIFISTNGLT